jgi:hypothetical protein
LHQFVGRSLRGGTECRATVLAAEILDEDFIRFRRLEIAACMLVWRAALDDQSKAREVSYLKKT